MIAGADVLVPILIAMQMLLLKGNGLIAAHVLMMLLDDVLQGLHSCTCWCLLAPLFVAAKWYWDLRCGIWFLFIGICGCCVRCDQLSALSAPFGAEICWWWLSSALWRCWFCWTAAVVELLEHAVEVSCCKVLCGWVLWLTASMVVSLRCCWVGWFEVSSLAAVCCWPLMYLLAVVHCWPLMYLLAAASVWVTEPACCWPPAAAITHHNRLLLLLDWRCIILLRYAALVWDATPSNFLDVPMLQITMLCWIEVVTHAAVWFEELC